jgi:uncharacterized protein
MSAAVFQQTIQQTFSNADLESNDILWLTGEPLVLGIDYFDQCVNFCLRASSGKKAPNFTVQTNGTLINEDWCDFFVKHDFVVGVSVDGPSAIHDKQRRTRAGEGSFQKVNRAIEMLIRKGVKGGAICVITKATLDYPAAELFSFFHERGISWSYLIEAWIGENSASADSLSVEDRPRLRAYLDELLSLWARHPGSYIRDFDQTARRLFGGSHPRFDPMRLLQKNGHP